MNPRSRSQRRTENRIAPTNPDDGFAGVASQVAAIRDGTTSARSLTEAALTRIERLDSTLNAFVQVLGEQARCEADQRDRDRDRGLALGPLHGVPIAVKDDIDIQGVPTGRGSAAIAAPAKADSAVVRRLRAAGAVIIGKTTMSELALWPYTETRAHGYTRNPWDLSRSPAGSSGGSAVAVASGMIAAAIGADGGGSIRLPAAHCGLFGLKPQRGRISPAPHAALWRALGVLGPLTRTVEDSAIVLDAIHGAEPTDQWRVESAPTKFAEAISAVPSGLRIAVTLHSPVGHYDLHAEVATAIDNVAATLARLGHDVVPANPIYPITAPAFVPQMLASVYDAVSAFEHPEAVERRTRQLAVLGRLTKRTNLDTWAEQRARHVATTVNQIFSRFDLLLMPVTSSPAPYLGQLDTGALLSAVRNSLPLTAFTSIWNVTGNPAASVPAGFSRDNLPLAVQLVAPPHREQTILQVAHQLESVLQWPDHRPPTA